MANKRTLKRAINGICEDMFVECVAASLYGAEKQAENAEALLSTILTIQRNYINRVSHPEPGMKAKDYYKDLCEKFAKQVNEVIDQINNM
ncbi:MAG: hypothetical protein IJT98_05650 [Prevotella sp.]|nr:hypothetical protein [Prevotella sp.]